MPYVWHILYQQFLYFHSHIQHAHPEFCTCVHTYVCTVHMLKCLVFGVRLLFMHYMSTYCTSCTVPVVCTLCTSCTVPAVCTLCTSCTVPAVCTLCTSFNGYRCAVSCSKHGRCSPINGHCLCDKVSVVFLFDGAITYL